MTEPPSTGNGINDADDVDELIDGFSLDELSDYLDSAREPVRLDIEESPEARHALARLERLRVLSGELLDADSATAASPDESWFQSIIRGLSREVRAGRPIPILSPDPAVKLTVSEGALRALIRDTGDSVPGAIVGRTRFDGDLTTPGAHVTVNIDLTAYAHIPLPDLADRIRAATADALHLHTDLTVAAINITVTDIYTTHPGGTP